MEFGGCHLLAKLELVRKWNDDEAVYLVEKKIIRVIMEQY